MRGDGDADGLELLRGVALPDRTLDVDAAADRDTDVDPVAGRDATALALTTALTLAEPLTTALREPATVAVSARAPVADAAPVVVGVDVCASTLTVTECETTAEIDAEAVTLTDIVPGATVNEVAGDVVPTPDPDAGPALGVEKLLGERCALAVSVTSGDCVAGADAVPVGDAVAVAEPVAVDVPLALPALGVIVAPAVNETVTDALPALLTVAARLELLKNDAVA